MSTTVTKSIFLADDDHDDCDLFQEALHEVSDSTILRRVANCLELVSGLRKSAKPDVIIMDINMPLKDGVECLDDLKLSDSLKQIPVIVFSTSSHVETINKVYEKGARHYIKKPCSFAELKQIVHRVVNMHFPATPGPTPREDFHLRF